MTARRIGAAIIIFIALGLGYLNYLAESGTTSAFNWLPKFKLGLDLRGGSQLVYEADPVEIAKLPPAEVAGALESLREVIERRINAFGVGEPVIQLESVGLGESARERLIVELPGVTDLQQAIAQINVTPILEFKTERPDGAEKEAILAAIEQAKADMEAGKPITPTELLLQDPYFISSPLTGRYLERAQVVFTPGVINPAISLEFNEEGGEIFATLTKTNVGKAIGIYLDGVGISAPVVREEIRDGKAEISGQFTIEEARELARNLNLGALPVPIKLVSTETIGATLGADALARGINAGLIGLAVVGLFMLLWYRLPGLVSIIALTIYIILILTIFRLVGVTLTAAGIAGLILSFGMSLDSNILIFERLKEEIKAGKHLHDAIKEGFARAWFSIRDSNLSSLIAGIVLFWFGTSLIKGFAVTLVLGLIVGLFTAISVTRTLLLALAPAHAGRVSKFLFKCGFK